MFKKLKSSRELSVEDSVITIELAELHENHAIMAYREETDPDYKESHKEDAYLNRLIQIRESRMLGKKDYEKQRLQACVGLSYEDLHICEYEDYEIE
jgi:hypothetical protein